MLKGRFYLIPMALGLISFISFTFSPATIDSNGILREPFYLIIFGYIGVFLSVFMVIISRIFKNSIGNRRI